MRLKKKNEMKKIMSMGKEGSANPRKAQIKVDWIVHGDMMMRNLESVCYPLPLYLCVLRD